MEQYDFRSDYALVVKFSRATQDIRVTIIGAGPHLDEEEQARMACSRSASP